MTRPHCCWDCLASLILEHHIVSPLEVRQPTHQKFGILTGALREDKIFAQHQTMEVGIFMGLHCDLSERHATRDTSVIEVATDTIDTSSPDRETGVADHWSKPFFTCQSHCRHASPGCWWPLMSQWLGNTLMHICLPMYLFLAELHQPGQSALIRKINTSWRQATSAHDMASKQAQHLKGDAGC